MTLASSSSGSPSDGASTELVERPEAGLARGRWEAPAWVFWAIALAAVLGGLTWGALALRTRRTSR